MTLGALFARLRMLVELNSIRVVAAVIGMLHDAGHPAFGDDRMAIDLNNTGEIALAGIDLTPVQCDIVVLYCIGYFTGDFPEVAHNYPDYLVAVHTIGEWCGWEAAMRDITGYGVDQYAAIRADIWQYCAPAVQPADHPEQKPGMWDVDPMTGYPAGHPLQLVSVNGAQLVDPAYVPVPDLIDFSIAALRSARISLEKVIGSPDRPIRSVASFTVLTDLIVDLTTQSERARQG